MILVVLYTKLKIREEISQDSLFQIAHRMVTYSTLQSV